jgi:Domain of unknown function (DUF4915)
MDVMITFVHHLCGHWLELLQKAERSCGVWVIDIETGQTVAWVKFQDAVQEIFAVEVLPQARFPDVVIDNREILAGSFVLPDQALAEVFVLAPSPTAAEDSKAAREFAGRPSDISNLLTTRNN